MTYIPTESPTDFNFFPIKKDDMTTGGSRPINQITIDNTYQALFNRGSEASEKLKFNIAAPCIAMFWKGMETNKNSIKITFHRTFNMEPIKTVRHIVNLEGPPVDVDPVETMTKVIKVSRMAPFGGHTIRSEEGARVVLASSQNFANILQLEADSKFGGLGEFASALEAP